MASDHVSLHFKPSTSHVFRARPIRTVDTSTSRHSRAYTDFVPLTDSSSASAHTSSSAHGSTTAATGRAVGIYCRTGIRFAICRISSRIGDARFRAWCRGRARLGVGIVRYEGECEMEGMVIGVMRIVADRTSRAGSTCTPTVKIESILIVVQLYVSVSSTSSDLSRHCVSSHLEPTPVTWSHCVANSAMSRLTSAFEQAIQTTSRLPWVTLK